MTSIPPITPAPKPSVLSTVVAYFKAHPSVAYAAAGFLAGFITKLVF